MNPSWKIKSGSTDITANIRDRFCSLTITDEAGYKSDRFSLTLDDRPLPDGSYIKIPKRKETLSIEIGYEDKRNHKPMPGLMAMGQFVINEIEWEPCPSQITINGAARDDTGKYKQSRNKSWHRSTIGEIVKDCAEYCGFQAAVDKTLIEKPVAHEDQVMQSTQEFLRVFGERYGAVAKIQNKTVIFAPINSVKENSTIIPKEPIILRVADLLPGTLYVSSGKTAFTAIRAQYDTKFNNVTGFVEITPPSRDATEGVSQALATRTLPGIFPSKEEAIAAATNRMRILQSQECTFHFECVGNPEIMAESIIRLEGLRPGLVTDWRVLNVKHTISDKFVSSGDCAIADKGLTESETQEETPEPEIETE